MGRSPETNLQIPPDASKALAQKEQTRDMFFQEGLTERQIDQLVNYSTNTELPGYEILAKNTSDPDRFKDRAAVEKWLKKGRFVVTLTDADSNLLGICWLGQEGMPTEGKQFTNEFSAEDTKQYGVTYAIRTYGRGRGAKVSGLLTKATLDAYKESEEYEALKAVGQHRIWLEVEADNEPAIRSYTNSGCIPITQPYETIDKYGKFHTKLNMVFPAAHPDQHITNEIYSASSIPANT